MVFAVEGDDDKIVFSYWVNRVDSSLSYEFFVCSGKREVRRLCNSLFADRSDAARDVAFFVDRDFDDTDGFDTLKNVFVLDRYSIENYVVDVDVLKETVRVAFPGSGNPATRNSICEMFLGDYLKFLEISTNLNLRVFIGRRLRIDIDDNIPDSLAKLANVNLGSVFPCEPPPEDGLIVPTVGYAGVDELVEEFGALEPMTRYRGKFAYKFFRGWLERLADEYRNSRLGLFPPSEDKDGRVKHDEMSLGALSCRSSMPNGLADFLGKLTASGR